MPRVPAAAPKSSPFFGRRRLHGPSASPPRRRRGPAATEYPRRYVYPGATKKPHPYPVELTPHLKAQYFEERESPGLHTLFANPMLLMMLFTGGLVMFMPKLMDGLDPEEKKKLEEQMGSAGDPTALLKNMFGMPSGDADDSDDDEPKQKSIKRK